MEQDDEFPPSDTSQKLTQDIEIAHKFYTKHALPLLGYQIPMKLSWVPGTVFVIATAISAFCLLQFLCQPNIKPPPALPSRSSTPPPAKLIEKRGLRVATYNIAFLTEKEHPERIENIRSVISNLQPDILALQEIYSRRALETVLGTEWEIFIWDKPDEDQEVALAVRKPLSIAHAEFLFSGKEFDDAFPGMRDVLRAIIATPNGPDIALYVVHLKSRSGGRRLTDPQRIMGAGLLASYIRARNEPKVILLGDFNDSPDDASLNILETGNLFAPGKLENDPDPFLVNLCEPLWAQDFVSFGVHTLFRSKPITPRVRGARKENDRWRNKDYRYPDDLSIIQVLFDQILLSPELAKLAAGPAQIYSQEDALRGTPSARGGMGTLASDHLPVYVDLVLPSK